LPRTTLIISKEFTKMKRLVTSIAACTIVAAGLLPITAHASVARAAQSSPMVVATWFSNLHPKVGQRETVHVLFFQGTHRFGGAVFSATVTYGKRTVRLKSSKTTTRGEAWANFTVPRDARGRTLTAHAVVTYKAHRYTGSNHVNVAR
jgi:hypothetical protein